MSHRTVPCVVVALVLASRLAAADPIEITGGQANYAQAHVAEYRLFGSGGFSAFFFLNCCSESQPVPYVCGPCDTGSLLNPSISESLAGIGTGEFTLSGTSYRLSSGEWAFDVPPVVIHKPTTVDVGTLEQPELMNQWVFRDVPFTFHGTLAGMASSGVEQTVHLSGRGLWSFSTGVPPWFASYSFASSAPVPEPGSFLLLGVGVVALMQRRTRAAIRAPVGS
jgi:PEP-CTERM motif-containing protein